MNADIKSGAQLSTGCFCKSNPQFIVTWYLFKLTLKKKIKNNQKKIKIKCLLNCTKDFFLAQTDSLKKKLIDIKKISYL